MLQIGDHVRYLNAVGGGRVVKIEGQMAYVDEDGFETPVLVKECVVVAHAGQEPRKTTFVSPTPVSEPVKSESAKAPEATLPVIEVPTGDVLNLVLGYEPTDIQKLSESSFDAYLVNDSNYFIAFTYLTKQDGEEWVMLSHGVIEPNIQEFIAEVRREDLARMDKIAVQLIAWKEGRHFAMKPAITIEPNLDVTKFFKLHCFQKGEYFDVPTLAVDLVRDDKPAGRKMTMDKEPGHERETTVTAKQLERAMRTKKNSDRRRPTVKHAQTKERGGIIEVDLHIEELVDTTAGLSPADMLNLQVDEFRRVMDANLKKKGQKIVFIHGKGEGVLRNALMKELKHRYKTCQAADASFQEYGYGATQVTI